jgi:hypothetical protein
MWTHRQPILMQPRILRNYEVSNYGIYFPGFTPPQLEGKVWWFPFHQLPDLSESLVEGKELYIYHGSIIILRIIYLQSLRRISTNLLAIIMLQAECEMDLATSEHFQKMRFKIRIIPRLLSFRCQYWR